MISRTQSSIKVFELSLILGSVGLGALAQALIKAGAEGLEGISVYNTLVAAFAEPMTILGICFYGISSALWLVVLSRVPLSAAYPFGALSYVLVVFLASISGEAITAERWLGVALIITGILLISTNSLSKNS